MASFLIFSTGSIFQRHTISQNRYAENFVAILQKLEDLSIHAIHFVQNIKGLQF